MTENYTYDATHLTLIREGTVELTQSADLGQVGTGRVVLDDTAGTQAIVGQKDFSATQSACSRPLLFRGYVDERSYSRDGGIDRQPHVGAGRGIAVQVVDTNALLGFDAFRTSAAKRPAETVAARGAWLMSTDQTAGFADNGRCDFSADKGMDAADYRNQYPGDVLADMALAQGGVNYHVNDYGSGPELTFRDDNAQTSDSSTLRVSNVLADASGVTLHPFKDAELTRRPGRVYSLLALAYAKGTRYAERAATATTFNGRRVGIISNSNIKTAAKADDELVSLLHQHSTEEDVIECTVLATDAQVNLMPPGWRIEGKFSHLATEGYGSFSWFVILEITKKPIVADAGLYEVRLKLSPQEAAAGLGNIVQQASIRTGPGGGTLTLPNPVTIGNHLIFAVSKAACSGNPGSPSVSASLPRFTTGGWTRFNGVQEQAASTVFGTKDDGCAIYWLEADTTSQEQWCGSYEVVTVWEITAADPASATLEYVNAGTGGATYDLTTLGTVAVGSMAFGVWCIGEYPVNWPWGGPGAPPMGAYTWTTPAPVPGISTGWTIAKSMWSYDHYSSGYYIPAHPWGITAYAEGTGVALNTAITPGHAGHGFGGLAVVIPPL